MDGLRDDEDDDEDDDEPGLVRHKDSFDKWIAAWADGVDLWTDMMGEDDENDE